MPARPVIGTTLCGRVGSAAEVLGKLGPRAAAAVPALKALRARGDRRDADAAAKALRLIDPGAAQ